MCWTGVFLIKLEDSVGLVIVGKEVVLISYLKCILGWE